MKPLFLALSLLCACGPLAAQEYRPALSRPVRALLGVGLTAGGDNLATLRYAQGSSSSVKAGGLVYFKGGVDWSVTPVLSLQGTFGYHGDAAVASNADLTFERNFVEGAAGFATTRNQRLLVGLRRASGARLKSSGAASGIGTVDFDSRQGFLVEYEWLFRVGRVGMGATVRYVNEAYTATAWNGRPVRGEEMDGSHLGIGFHLYL